MKRITNDLLPIVAACAAVLLSPAAGAAVPQWTIYKPSNTGIPGDYTRDIFVGADGKPWIPGYIPFRQEGGMSRYDSATATWFAVTNVDYPVITSPRFHDIDSDADGIMWIGSEGGLLRYDPAVGPSSLVRYDASNTPMPGHHVWQVSIAPDGSVWLAIYNVGGGGQGLGGLVRFDPGADTWDVWTTANGLPWGGDWPGWDGVDYAAAAPDPDGGYTVIFGSTEMGAASYKDGVFTWFQDNPTIPLIYGLPSDDPVDAQGHMWLSTDQGLARRNPDGTMTIVGAPVSGSVEAFSGGRAGLRTSNGDVWVYDGATWTSYGNWGGGTTHALAEEAPGVLWVGGTGGAAQYKEGVWQRYRLTNTGMVGFLKKTIDFDAAGNVYVNGNAAPGVGGFSIFDGERWTCVNDLNYGLGPVWGLPSDDVQALCTRADGHVAIAPEGIQGLLDWDGGSYAYLLGQGIEIDVVAEDSLGRLWGARDDYTYGLFRITGGTFEQYLAATSPLPAGEISAIIADAANPGFVWVIAAYGMAHTDGDTWTVYPREMLGLVEEEIGHFIWCGDVAADGTLWLGSGLGAFHFDPVSGDFTQYGLAGTTLPSDDVHQIEVAPDGSIWMGTFDMDYPYPGGLTRFDGVSWTTWTATTSRLPHNQLAVLRSRPVANGYELWVGTAGDGVAVLTIEDVPSCPQDLDGDAEVGFADVLRVIAAWGPCAPGACDEDLNGNGSVDFADILAVIGAWGPCT